MAGLGPMSSQNHYFSIYAQEKITYVQERYIKETTRPYGVLKKELEKNEFVAGEYSIADMAIYPWIVPWQKQGQNLDELPAGNCPPDT
jgi:GSH-dependent disulfide-bond oxidoreductase